MRMLVWGEVRRSADRSAHVWRLRGTAGSAKLAQAQPAPALPCRFCCAPSRAGAIQRGPSASRPPPPPGRAELPPDRRNGRQRPLLVPRVRHHPKPGAGVHFRGPRGGGWRRRRGAAQHLHPHAGERGALLSPREPPSNPARAFALLPCLPASGVNAPTQTPPRSSPPLPPPLGSRAPRLPPLPDGAIPTRTPLLPSRFPPPPGRHPDHVHHHGRRLQQRADGVLRQRPRGAALRAAELRAARLPAKREAARVGRGGGACARLRLRAAEAAMVSWVVACGRGVGAYHHATKAGTHPPRRSAHSLRWSGARALRQSCSAVPHQPLPPTLCPYRRSTSAAPWSRCRTPTPWWLATATAASKYSSGRRRPWHERTARPVWQAAHAHRCAGRCC